MRSSSNYGQILDYLIELHLSQPGRSRFIGLLKDCKCLRGYLIHFDHAAQIREPWYYEGD